MFRPHTRRHGTQPANIRTWQESLEHTDCVGHIGTIPVDRARFDVRFHGLDTSGWTPYALMMVLYKGQPHEDAVLERLAQGPVWADPASFEDTPITPYAACILGKHHPNIAGATPPYRMAA